MAGITAVGLSTADGGMLGPEARTQYAAMAQMRWRMFMNGLRSIHGLLDLGATGIAWLLYSIYGLGLGTCLCVAAYSIASRATWQYLPILFWAISFLWLMFPMAVASFQEQADLGILLRFPVHFGSYFLLDLISGLMETSTIVGLLCCLGVWLGIVMARPDLGLWTMLGLSVLAAFNILLVRAVFAWIDRWLAQRKTREILGLGFMILFVSLLLINSVRSQKHIEGSESDTGEGSGFTRGDGRICAVAEDGDPCAAMVAAWAGCTGLQRAIDQKPAAGIASLGLLGFWAVLAGGALAGRLKAQYRGQNLSWAPRRENAIRHGSGWTLGGSGPFIAIVEKELRSLLRSAPSLWAVSVPLLFVLVRCGRISSRPLQCREFVSLCVSIVRGIRTAGIYGTVLQQPGR